MKKKKDKKIKLALWDSKAKNPELLTLELVLLGDEHQTTRYIQNLFTCMLLSSPCMPIK